MHCLESLPQPPTFFSPPTSPSPSSRAAAGATPRADAAPPTSKGAPAEGAAGIAADVSAPPTEAGDSGSLEGGVSEVSALKLADANHNLSSPPSAAACFVGAVGELLFRAAGPGAPAR